MILATYKIYLFLDCVITIFAWALRGTHYPTSSTKSMAELSTARKPPSPSTTKRSSSPNRKSSKSYKNRSPTSDSILPVSPISKISPPGKKKKGTNSSPRNPFSLSTGKNQPRKSLVSRVFLGRWWRWWRPNPPIKSSLSWGNWRKGPTRRANLFLLKR